MDPLPTSAQPRATYADVRGHLLVTLLTVLVIWALGATQALSYLGFGRLYDLLLALAPAPAGESAVLLVELEPGFGAGDPGWPRRLSERLAALGARGLLFSVPPPAAPGEALPAVIGRRVLALDPERGEALLEPLPAPLAGLPWAVSALPTPVAGIHPAQFLRLPAEGETRPLLESAALAAGAALPGQGPFLINFMGGAERLPRLDAARLLAGEGVPELVRGRTVLVGGRPGPGVPGLLIPRVGSPALSLAEFQGLAADTLLRGLWIRPTPAWLTLPLLLTAALAALIGLRRAGAQLALWSSAGVLAALLIAGALLLHYARLWLPLPELVLTLILMPLLTLWHRQRRASEELRLTLLDTVTTLADRLVPQDFYAAPEHWTQLTVMVNQTLDLNRLIFLERVAGDHRVREIKALHCSLEEINERRRDYEREPYLSALSSGRPTLLTERLFLSHDPQEDQYLVPLSFAGEVLGFWAFGIERSHREQIPHFETTVAEFGEQISELLYHRQQRRTQEALESRGLHRVLALPGAEHQDLRNAVHLLERRMAILEELLGGLGEAVLLYDLFGRLLHMNDRMRDELGRGGHSPFAMTALDFLTGVAGLEPNRARQLLRQVTLDRESTTLPILLPGTPPRPCILSIRPLQSRASELAGRDGPMPFQVKGVLFELLEGSRDAGRQGLLEGGAPLAARLRRELEALAQAPAGSAPAHLPRLLELVQGALEGPAEGRRVPLELRRALLTAAQEQGLALGRPVTLELELPEPSPLLLAPAEELIGLLGAVLILLAEDAAEGSPLRVRLVAADAEGWVACRFENSGFGLPDERFQAYLEPSGESGSESFRRLKRHRRVLEHWGGSLSGSSRVGVGTTIVLQVPGVV